MFIRLPNMRLILNTEHITAIKYGAAMDNLTVWQVDDQDDAHTVIDNLEDALILLAAIDCSPDSLPDTN